jgi:hypothetical protein
MSLFGEFDSTYNFVRCFFGKNILFLVAILIFLIEIKFSKKIIFHIL